MPQLENKQQRRVLFTTDAKFAITRKPAMKMAAAGDNQQPEQSAQPEQVTLEGYPIVWNALSSDRGGYKVKLLPNSAKFTDEVHALFHHDFRAILGATGNTTLRIASDSVGVKVEIDLPNTNTGRDVAELVEKRYVKGMSFSMLWEGIEYDIKDADTDSELMEVKSFLCDEVTITAVPSFTETTIGLQQEDDAESPDDQPALASARIEQSIKLERLRLANLEI